MQPHLKKSSIAFFNACRRALALTDSSNYRITSFETWWSKARAGASSAIWAGRKIWSLPRKRLHRRRRRIEDQRARSRARLQSGRHTRQRESLPGSAGRAARGRARQGAREKIRDHDSEPDRGDVSLRQPRLRTSGRHGLSPKFLKAMEPKYGIKILDRELACAPFDSPEGRDYFAAMKCGLNMSFANRQ